MGFGAEIAARIACDCLHPIECRDSSRRRTRLICPLGAYSECLVLPCKRELRNAVEQTLRFLRRMGSPSIESRGADRQIYRR